MLALAMMTGRTFRYEFPGSVSGKSIDKTGKIPYTKIAGRDTLYTHITEFAFKCHVLAPAVGPPKGGFLR